MGKRFTAVAFLLTFVAAHVVSAATPTFIESADGKRLVSMDDPTLDQAFQEVSVDGKTVLYIHENQILKDPKESPILVLDDNMVLVFTNDRVLTSFDIASGEGKKLLDNGVLVSTMSLSTDGKTLILAGTGIAPWSIALPEGTVSDHAYAAEDRVMSAAISPDEKWLAGGANEGDVYLWPLNH